MNGPIPDAAKGAGVLARYAQASTQYDEARNELAGLEQHGEVDLFQKQLTLLRRRLLAEPGAFRQMFIADGMEAIAWEFQQNDLGANFTRTLWDLLLRGDDMSTVLLRFVWAIPLKFKRKFIRAIDANLSDRYPMFKGLSKGWPGLNSSPPYMRPAD